MRRKPRTTWTDKSDSVGHLFQTLILAGARPAFEISPMTGGVIVTPAFQLSDDGETWDGSNMCGEIANVTPRTDEMLLGSPRLDFKKG